MTIRVVRLGSPRAPDEGLRLGTVRRPPRGVAKAQFAKQNWYDVWYPTLAPSAGLVATARQAQSPAQWRTFVKRYKDEMTEPAAKHAIELLAALSHSASFSVGCYCEDEARCHRSVLRQLLADAGADIVE